MTCKICYKIPHVYLHAIDINIIFSNSKSICLVLFQWIYLYYLSQLSICSFVRCSLILSRFDRGLDEHFNVFSATHLNIMLLVAKLLTYLVSSVMLDDFGFGRPSAGSPLLAFVAPLSGSSNRLFYGAFFARHHFLGPSQAFVALYNFLSVDCR